MDQSVKVASDTEGKVGGYFCRLPPLNKNTVTIQYIYKCVGMCQSKALVEKQYNARHFLSHYPHAFLKKRRGYCNRLSVRLSVRYAISSQTIGRNSTKFGV